MYSLKLLIYRILKSYKNEQFIQKTKLHTSIGILKVDVQ